MISNIDTDILKDISLLLQERLAFCSLLEYYPTNYNADVEVKSKAYLRLPVAWRVVGDGLMVNKDKVVFIGLEEPTVVMAIGLHSDQHSHRVNAWGALGTSMRATNNRLVIPANTLAVRVG